MITKEQKQLIEEVKRESGTNEFLSVSDLIVRIEQNYKEKGETLYYEDAGITFSLWNDFLRNTPLSMDLFIGEDAIFVGFVNSKEYCKYPDEFPILTEGEVVFLSTDYELTEMQRFFQILIKQNTNSSLAPVDGLRVVFGSYLGPYQREVLYNLKDLHKINSKFFLK